jgi:penicillin-binding protein 1A
MVLFQAVTRVGTGAAAAQMKHALGGKTGTTNNYTDAWFVGFSPSVTCGTWIGFDNRQSLGDKETGAKAALPMWMDFMKVALADRPNEEFSRVGAPKKTLAVPLPAAGVTQPAPVKPRDDAAPELDDDKTPEPPSSPTAAPTPVQPQGSEPLSMEYQLTPNDTAASQKLDSVTNYPVTKTAPPKSAAPKAQPHPQ